MSTDISCAYASWRQRGWCRLEFVAAELARNDIKCMLIKGGGATPEFVFSADAMFLSPGLGRFTCCSRKHVKPNGEFMKCDKMKIGMVLDVMLDAKIDHLFLARKWFAARYYVCVGHWLRRGLDAPSMVFKRTMSASCFFDASMSVSMSGHGSGASSSRNNSVASSRRNSLRLAAKWDNALPFLKSLHWRFGNTLAEHDFAVRTGTSALFWATMSNQRDVLDTMIEVIRDSKGERVLLEEINRPLTNPNPQFTIPAMASPLHLAMAWCSWGIVDALLGAGANPLAMCGPRGSRCVSPPHAAAMFGRSDNITRWAARFGNPSINRPGPQGMTTLHYAVRRLRIPAPHTQP